LNLAATTKSHCGFLDLCIRKSYKSTHQQRTNQPINNQPVRRDGNNQPVRRGGNNLKD